MAVDDVHGWPPVIICLKLDEPFPILRKIMCGGCSHEFSDLTYEESRIQKISLVDDNTARISIAKINDVEAVVEIDVARHPTSQRNA